MGRMNEMVEEGGRRGGIQGRSLKSRDREESK